MADDVLCQLSGHCPRSRQARRASFQEGIPFMISFSDTIFISRAFQIETSTPSEITIGYVDEEIAHVTGQQTSSTDTVKAGFARPVRPGRKR